MGKSNEGSTRVARQGADDVPLYSCINRRKAFEPATAELLDGENMASQIDKFTLNTLLDATNL